jgi:hypothetical protein
MKNKTEKTLTDFQKDYFDCIITQHIHRKKTDPTISQLNNLIDYIVKNYEINFTMICHITGKILTGDKKHYRMIVQDMGMLENILDW